MNKLKELREAKNMTKTELFEKTGISRQILNFIESGQRKMTLNHAKALAPFFNVSIDYILGTDAIVYVNSFSDGLKNLIDAFLFDILDKTSEAELNDHDKLRYIICDIVLKDYLSKDDLDDVYLLIKDLAKSGDIQ